MSGPVNRRGMLRSLLGEATRAARVITDVRDELAWPETPKRPPAEEEEEEREERSEPTVVRPPAGLHYASPEELQTLAIEAGLGRRLDDVMRLARPSARILPATGEALHLPARSRAGGTPDLPAAAAGPGPDLAELPFVAQLNLGHISGCLGNELGPGLRGMLWCFLDPDAPEAGDLVPGAARCVVTSTVSVGASGASPSGAITEDGGLPLRFAAELTLPRVWSAPVQALDPPIADPDSWEGLRGRLADLQGLSLADTFDDRAVVHRFLGYPDERVGAMPLLCAKLAAGFDLGSSRPVADALRRDLEHQALRWRMLLQLSGDRELGWSLRDGRRRLYLWVHEDDLLAKNLDRLIAIAQ